MAVYIEIRRTADREYDATYTFGLTDGREGELVVDKKTGASSMTRQMPGDDPPHQHYLCAAHKLKKHWEKGALPELTSWAS